MQLRTRSYISSLSLSTSTSSAMRQLAALSSRSVWDLRLATSGIRQTVIGQAIFRKNCLPCARCVCGELFSGFSIPGFSAHNYIPYKQRSGSISSQLTHLCRKSWICGRCVGVLPQLSCRIGLDSGFGAAMRRCVTNGLLHPVTNLN
jgi:hypothetical protein